MDDILSAALAESGLDFLCQQSSPTPSTSGSIHDDAGQSFSNNTHTPSVSQFFDETSNDSHSSSAYYTPMATPFVSTEDGGVPTSFFGMDEEDGGCTIMTTAGTSGSNNIDGIEDAGGGMYYPHVKVIPRKHTAPTVNQSEPSTPTVTIVPKKEDPLFETNTADSPTPSGDTSTTASYEGNDGLEDQETTSDRQNPMFVQTARSTDGRLDTPSTSATVSPHITSSLTQRSHTSSPASSASEGTVVPPRKKGLPITTGSIVKRTVQTKDGLQTQYLKAFVNENGEKIYKLLSPVAASAVARGTLPPGMGRGGSTIGRGGTMVNKNGERLMVVKNHVGPNGQMLVKRMVSPAGTRIVANGGQGRGQPIYRAVDGSNGPTHLLRRTTTTGQPTRGAPVGMAARHAVRGGTVYGGGNGYRVNLVGRGTGGSTMVHHQPLNRISSQRSVAPVGRVLNRGALRNGAQQPLHVSTSSPAFHYMEEQPSPTTNGMVIQAKTPGAGVIQARHMQSQQSFPSGGPARVLMNRSSTNAGLSRMVGGGYDQQLPTAPNGRLMIPSTAVRVPGSGMASPRLQTTPQPLTKSQKAKDEMKMAYQVGREEALQQRRNDLEDDEENLGYAETYSEYTPAKLRSGMAHPDSVVESASLSSVSPPDVKYQISIPEYLIDMGHISALQLEAVIYACQMHERRMPSGERYGYLIGDGAGVGKGRTVACIIFENYLQGRKRAIWLSVSSDLKFDAERDLRDCGAPNIPVYALNKMKYAKISGKENGSIKKGVMFATYTSLIGECRGAKSRKYRSRISQLIQWFGQDYDGVIILDECHRAKNLVPTAGAKPTKTGRMVLELQKALPNARVVYASATGATEPRNMAYMTRLGLWGERQAFPEFHDFISAVERRGVGAMEIVAMDMKQRGLYLARQLSFRGVSFAVQEVQLSSEFVKMYDAAVKLWMEARRQFQTVIETMDEEERSTCKTVWGQFWACHQRFFKYLCIAAKVDTCVQLSREAIKAKKCVVIGLQSTGESATLETLEEMGGELNEFVSTAKTVLYGLIDKHFPTDASFSMGDRDIFKDFDDFERPAKRRKTRETLSFLGDVGFDTWTGVTTGMGGRVGDGVTKNITRGLSGIGRSSMSSSTGNTNNEDANSTTSESSDGSDDEVENDMISENGGESGDLESAREEAEGARTLEDGEQDEWVKALLAEAESSSDDSDEEVVKDEDEDEEAESKSGETHEQEEEFNPFMCDFTNDDPWAHNQQIVEDTPQKDRKAKKRKRDEEEAERLREKVRKREERREKKRRRAIRRAEREKQRRNEELQARGSATDFITSSRICGNGSGEQDDINPMLIKTELLAAVERLAPSLPANTLDQLIDEMGGPEYVAEMTGRRGHMVTSETGDVMYQRRNANAEVSLELINMEEKEKFMRGEKLIAIISEAASSGISLQSDRRAINKRRRVHITLELPWSADKAIQQFGRTHRSNQVSGPEYVFLISELAGEKRFASIVAKRLESLGALTHGDRRATETRDLSQFNMDNKYGRVALDTLLKTVIGQAGTPLIDPPKDYKAGEFFEDMRLYMEGVGLLAKNKTGQYTIEKEAATIPKFLNRILGLPVHAQNSLFHYFSEIVAELIAQSKHDGTYDTGIMDLGTGDDQVRKLETRVFTGRVDNGSFRVEIHKIGVERGVSWEEAMELHKEHSNDDDGFYICHPGGANTANTKKVAALVYGIGKIRMDNGARLYAITRPSTGRSPKLMTMADLSKRFHKVSIDEAKEVWKQQYDSAANMCQHNYVYGKCRTESNGTYCEVGRRTRTYFVLSGSVLSVWPIVEEVLAGSDRKSSRMQVIRVRTEQDQKIVGLLVLPTHVRHLVQQLETHCGRSYVKTEP
ncbi:Protein strawberry notch homolog [Caenorhabditis elegans]|uniref:Protein strawberry notch homolog n=1 Tax=Caenorhabditis elegans TaxID=6239 RepID=SBNO_CAEEL|nr:Protein strawberry notch homolog [Caenorhabditis elegans]O01737.3 RecName: Full=Protein strawberry notch homolog; AltName: Full=Lethal protein 765; AltName: Full=Notch signaling pathway homolog 1 [Caenorhabditis elegans]ADF27719.1 notch signaling pathway homolog-1 [Caenorhabditis elegans]CCD69779.1 Protein strawberry notch homolog [Caenorhabditis elegans]|eukprot:NP_498455.2 Uncharacterized protein CELE_F20H11.2 [Caenorhabditis elegans]